MLVSHCLDLDLNDQKTMVSYFKKINENYKRKEKKNQRAVLEIFQIGSFSNFMHGLKSAILAFFQKSADWLDWPCPVSAALHFRS